MIATYREFSGRAFDSTVISELETDIEGDTAESVLEEVEGRVYDTSNFCEFRFEAGDTPYGIQAGRKITYQKFNGADWESCNRSVLIEALKQELSD